MTKKEEKGAAEEFNDETEVETCRSRPRAKETPLTKNIPPVFDASKIVKKKRTPVTRKKKEIAASKIKKEAKEASKPSALKKKDKIEGKKDTKSVAAPTIVKTTPPVLPPSDEEIARMLFAEINGMRRRGRYFKVNYLDVITYNRHYDLILSRLKLANCNPSTQKQRASREEWRMSYSRRPQTYYSSERVDTILSGGFTRNRIDVSKIVELPDVQQMRYER